MRDVKRRGNKLRRRGMERGKRRKKDERRGEGKKEVEEGKEIQTE